MIESLDFTGAKADFYAQRAFLQKYGVKLLRKRSIPGTCLKPPIYHWISLLKKFFHPPFFFCSMYRFLTLFVALLFAQGLFAQADFNREHIVGDFLVKLRAGATPKTLLDANQIFQGSETRLEAVAQLSEPLNIWHLRFDPAKAQERGMMAAINRHADVEIIQLNYVVQQRGGCAPNATSPNDPQFNQQWQYINNGANGGVVDADIDAELAWDITTGGLTALGDTIVVCVIDDGVDINHPDMAPNLWRNWAEIPNNGVDDDGNGYVDDYRGWNAADNNDDVANAPFGGGHGTPVAGIVGAKGNNGIGVSGVNWDVKLMIVVNGGPLTSATVIASYSYPYTMRQRYNQTGGLEGAFVVATNSSWGIDFGQPANEPLWCAFYDSLGAVGILSCGAGPNGNINVDTQGDLPTACSSDWLISVTNMNRSDVKLTQAGYGTVTIDLGAFGQDTWTAADNGGYGAFGGTSGATPHVTGTVALLYSAPCPAFINLAKIAPAQAALLVKQYILDGTDPNASLTGITVTEGRLNMNGALQELLANCPADTACLPAFSVQAVVQNDTTINIDWVSLDTATYSMVRFREIGAATWDSLPGNAFGAQLTNLTACTEYEFQVGLWCDSTTFSGYSALRTIRTSGCCEAPATLFASVLDSTNAVLHWANVPAGNGYVVEYGIVGGTWTALPVVTADSVLLENLSACSEYRFRVSRACVDGSQTQPTPEFLFNTLGCGNCVDLPYCTIIGDESQFEWIESMTLGNYVNVSGNNGGYELFSATGIVLNQGGSYAISLDPDFSGQTYNEVFRVWLDADQNGLFDDVSELLYESSPTPNIVTANITVPAATVPGITRLRVAMSWDEPTASCGNYDYGETEDYCVTIDSLIIGTPQAAGPFAHFTVYPNPTGGAATVSIGLDAPAASAWLEIRNAQGQQLHTQNLGELRAGSTLIPLTVLGEMPSGLYFVQMLLPEGTKTLRVVKR